MGLAGKQTDLEIKRSPAQIASRPVRDMKVLDTANFVNPARAWNLITRDRDCELKAYEEDEQLATFCDVFKESGDNSFVVYRGLTGRAITSRHSGSPRNTSNQSMFASVYLVSHHQMTSMGFGSRKQG
jgi:hypothetical protein